MDAQRMKWLIEAQAELNNFLKNSKELFPLAIYALDYQIILLVHPKSQEFNKGIYYWSTSFLAEECESIRIPFNLESKTIFSVTPEESQTCFAHELGHAENIPEPLNCSVDRSNFPGDASVVCAYEELRAHFKGHEILQTTQLLNESLEKFYWQSMKETLNKYYKNCLTAIKEQRGRCPREKGVLKMLQEKNLL